MASTARAERAPLVPHHGPLALVGALLLAASSSAQDGGVVRESAASQRFDDRRETAAQRADEGTVPRYGWHYEWDADRGEWRRTYGWYEEFYEDDPAGSRARDARARDGSGDASGVEWSERGWDGEPREARTATRDQQVITGTIESFGQKREIDGTHYLLRVRTDAGETRIVDLGTRVRPGELAFRRGDEVRFRGRPAMNGEMRVFRATAFSRDGRDGSATARQGGGTGRADAMGSVGTRSSGARDTFTGRLEGIRERRSTGGEGSTLLVLLERDDGTTRVVDLGPSARLRGLGLQRGDVLTVVGEPRESDGRKLLHAFQLRVGDSAMALRDTEDLLREELDTRPRQRTFRGELLQAERTRLAGYPETHLIMRLELAGGDAEIVDFGADVQPSDLPLDPGDRVTVRGQQEVRAGVSLLRAQELSVNGEPVDVGPLETGAAREASARRADTAAARTADDPYRVELSGTLEDFEETEIAGVAGDNLIVRMVFRDGTARIVELGSEHELSELGLERGARVHVVGVERTSGGKSFVCADEMRVGERTTRVDEHAKPATRGGSTDAERGARGRAEGSKETEGEGPR